MNFEKEAEFIIETFRLNRDDILAHLMQQMLEWPDEEPMPEIWVTPIWIEAYMFTLQYHTTYGLFLSIRNGDWVVGIPEEFQ